MATARLITRLLCLALLGFSITLIPASFTCPPGLMAAETTAQLRGRVLEQRGNQMPGPGRSPHAAGVARSLVVVAGQVSPRQLGDPWLPAAALQRPILARGRSGADGAFVIALPTATPLPARITLLLQWPDGYYLNRFDDQGHFASLPMPQALEQPQLLIDDRAASF